MASIGSAELEFKAKDSGISKAFNDIDSSFKKANATVSQFNNTVNKTQSGLGSFGNTLKQFIGIASITTAVYKFTQGLKSAMDASISFESAFAGIRKTVDATASEFTVLEDQFRSLAKEIPLSVEGLSKIGELGGQLGIAKESLIDFTKTIAAIGVSTNITEEAAATSFARIANIFQLPIANVENLASAIVDLGNNFATTESEIMTFATRIAGAGKVAGLTTSDIAAIGAAFSSVGVEAEMGGTAVQKTLLTMNTAVAEGGSKLADFARVSGMSASEFAERWKSAPIEAFDAFVQGVGKSGDNASAVLEELVGSDQRLIKAFLSISSAGDLLTRAIDTSSKAFAENTALSEEAGKRYATTESQLILLKGRWNDLKITIGNFLKAVAVPVINFFVTFAEGVAYVVPKLKVLWVSLAAVGVAFGLYRTYSFVLTFFKALNLAVASSSVLLGTNGFTKVVANAAASLSLIGKAAGATGPLSILKGAFIGLTTAVKGFSIALMANPIGLIIGGIVASIGALYFAWKNNFGGMRDEVTSFVESIKTRFGPMFESVKEVLAGLLVIFEVIFGQIINATFTFLNFVAGIFEGTFSGIIKVIKGLLQILTGDFEAGFKSIGGGVATLAKTIFNTFYTVVKSLIELFVKMVTAIAGILGDVAKVVAAVAKDLFGNWKTILSNILIMFVNWAKGVWDRVASIDWGSALSGIAKAVTGYLKDTLKKIGNWAKNVWKTIKSVFSGEEPITADVDVDVKEISSDKKKTFLQDLTDGIDEIDFSNTQAAVSEISQKYSSMFADTPKVAGAPSASLNGIKSSAEGATGAVEELNDQFGDLGKEGAGGTKILSEDIKELQTDILNSLKKITDNYRGGFADILDLDKEFINKRADEFEKGTQAILEKGTLTQGDLKKIVSNYSKFMEDVDNEILSQLKSSFETNFTEIGNLMETLEVSDFDIAQAFKMPDIDELVDTDSWNQFWEDYQGGVEASVKRLQELVSEQAKFFADLRKDTEDTTAALEGLEKKSSEKMVQTFFEQETKLKKLREELSSTDSDSSRVADLQAEISEIETMLRKHADVRKGIAAEIKEAERREALDPIAKLQEDYENEKAVLEERLRINNSFFEDTEMTKPKKLADVISQLKVLRDEVKNQENQEYIDKLLKEQEQNQLELDQAKAFLETARAQKEQTELAYQSFLATTRANEAAAFSAHLARQQVAMEAHKNAMIRMYNAIAAAARAAASAGGFSGGGYTGSFASGGYTGAGKKFDPAGIVHKNEYVIPSHMVNKLRPTGFLNALESMRRGLRGFADGGLVGKMQPAMEGGKNISITFNNTSREQAKTGISGDELMYQLRPYL